MERKREKVPSSIRTETGRRGVRVQIVEFEGHVFRRYPDSPKRNHRLYFGGWYHGERGYLHRAVWIYHKGPIPRGHYVHHKKDHDHNRIGTLKCLTPSAHNKLHYWEIPERHEFRGPTNLRRQILFTAL